MVTPTQPWPTPGRFDDALSEIVASGNVQQAREWFDRIFWGQEQSKPEWKHLRLAVMREDLPMIRLLATWGAHPSEEEMSHFRAVTGEKYAGYVRLMRQAGLRSNGQPWENVAPESNVQETRDDLIAKSMTDDTFHRYRLDRVPAEWLKVLSAFQQSGAEEAVIAGGALRDLYNARQVKDVDIFLRDQGSQKKNRRLLEAAFAASGVEVKAQEFTESDGYGTMTRKIAFPKPETETHSKFNDVAMKRERKMESWKVLAGPNRTEYNIIFVEDNLDRTLVKEGAKADAKSIFTGGLLDAFDTGLSQIATDGREIVSTEAYKSDVRNKQITLTRPQQTTEDHLSRIVRKYPDFTPDSAVVEALKPKPPVPRMRASAWY